jgi:hypothetical protein
MGIVEGLRELRRQVVEDYRHRHPKQGTDIEQAATEKATTRRREVNGLFQESRVLDELSGIDQQFLQGEESHGIAIDLDKGTAILAWGDKFSINLGRGILPHVGRKQRVMYRYITVYASVEDRSLGVSFCGVNGSNEAWTSNGKRQYVSLPEAEWRDRSNLSNTLMTAYKKPSVYVTYA